MEEARRQHDRDVLAIPKEGRDEAVKQAHIAWEQLSDQGIVLGYPTLGSDFQDEIILSLSGRGGNEQLASPAMVAEGEQSARSRIRWNWRSGYSGDVMAIENQLRTHEQALLEVVSDRIVQQRLREVQDAARSLIQDLAVAEVPSRKTQKVLEGGIAPLPLSPHALWKLYEDENKRLDGYPQAWEQLHTQLFSLDQIFVNA